MDDVTGTLGSSVELSLQPELAFGAFAEKFERALVDRGMRLEKPSVGEGYSKGTSKWGL